MSIYLHNRNQDADASTADRAQIATAQTIKATLRLIAHAPVPEGLEERVRARLKSASQKDRMQGKARVLAWPVLPMGLESDWMRTAAAAAIVAIVAGGGWGIYSRVERPQAAKAIVAPMTGTAGGGFSSAAAMRTPQTLNGPVLKHAPKNRPGKLAKKAPAAAGQGVQTDATDATQKPVQPAADAQTK